MSITILATLIFMSHLITPNDGGIDNVNCHLPELIAYETEYNALVCSAYEHLEVKNYSESLRLIEEAEKMSLFEKPNFRLFPVKAFIQHKLGFFDEAKEELLKAEVSINLYAGILRCASYEEDRFIEGYNINAYDQRLLNNLARQFCWPAYEGYYIRYGISVIDDEYTIYSRYIEYRTNILGNDE